MTEQNRGQREMSLQEYLDALPYSHKARQEFRLLVRRASQLDDFAQTVMAATGLLNQRSAQRHPEDFANEAQSLGAIGRGIGLPDPRAGWPAAGRNGGSGVHPVDPDTIGEANQDRARVRTGDESIGGPVRSQPMTAGPAGDPDALRKY